MAAKSASTGRANGCRRSGWIALTAGVLTWLVGGSFAASNSLVPDLAETGNLIWIAVGLALAGIAIGFGTIRWRQEYVSQARWRWMGTTALALALTAVIGYAGLYGDGIRQELRTRAVVVEHTDATLVSNLQEMASRQDTFVAGHPTRTGYVVGRDNQWSADDVFHGFSDNHIIVTLGAGGYCISAYNPQASKATSAAKSLLYRAGAAGVQQVLGTC